MDLKHNNIRVSSEQPPENTNFAKFFIVFVLIIGGGFFAYDFLYRMTTGSAIPYTVMARLDKKTVELAARANEDPCNTSVANMLVTRLVGKAEFAAAATFLDYTENKCGLDEGLLALKVLAQKGSSNFKGAEATVNKILEDHPSSTQAYQWRYEVRKGMENFQGAYDDLKKLVDLLPDPSRAASWVYYDLAHLAAKLKLPCEAVNTLRDYVAYDQLVRRTPQVENLLTKWQQEGNCPAPFGKGSARFAYNRAAPAVILPVTVNGVKTRMIIDTGASRTLLTKELAKQAGIEPSHRSGSFVTTVDKVSWQPGGRATEISLGEASSRNVPVFIQNTDKHTFGPNIGGLLGLSFLGNFDFTMRKGVLELKPL